MQNTAVANLQMSEIKIFLRISLFSNLALKFREWNISIRTWRIGFIKRRARDLDPEVIWGQTS